MEGLLTQVTYLQAHSPGTGFVLLLAGLEDRKEEATTLVPSFSCGSHHQKPCWGHFWRALLHSTVYLPVTVAGALRAVEKTH